MAAASSSTASVTDDVAAPTNEGTDSNTTSSLPVSSSTTTATTAAKKAKKDDDESSDEEGESHRPAPLACVVCSAARAIYKCPKCDRRSCSLDCVRRHKADNSCDGLQSRSTFTPISDISEKTILNDYFFLEEVQQTVNQSTRDTNIKPKGKWKPNNPSGQRLTLRMRHLQRHCHRYGAALHFMPEGMSRREQNDSHIIASVCQWRTEWLFDGANVKLVEKFDDTRTWRECLSYFLVPFTTLRPYFEEKAKNAPIVVPLLPRGTDGEWKGKRGKTDNSNNDSNDGKQPQQQAGGRGRGGRGRGRARGDKRHGGNKRVRIHDATNIAAATTNGDTASATPSSDSPSTGPSTEQSLSSSPSSSSATAVAPTAISTDSPAPTSATTSSSSLSSSPAAVAIVAGTVDDDAPEEVRRGRTVEPVTAPSVSQTVASSTLTKEVSAMTPSSSATPPVPTPASSSGSGGSSGGGEAMRRALRQAAERRRAAEQERDQERLKTGAWKKETIEVITQGGDATTDDSVVNGAIPITATTTTDGTNTSGKPMVVGDVITRMVSESFRDNSIVRAQLPDYIVSTREQLSTLRLFLRVAYSPANAATYYELPLDSTIRESLKGVSLIEFPSVNVALPSEVSRYTIVERPSSAAILPPFAAIPRDADAATPTEEEQAEIDMEKADKLVAALQQDFSHFATRRHNAATRAASSSSAAGAAASSSSSFAAPNNGHQHAPRYGHGHGHHGNAAHFSQYASFSFVSSTLPAPSTNLPVIGGVAASASTNNTHNAPSSNVTSLTSPAPPPPPPPPPPAPSSSIPPVSSSSGWPGGNPYPSHHAYGGHGHTNHNNHSNTNSNIGTSSSGVPSIFAITSGPMVMPPPPPSSSSFPPSRGGRGGGAPHHHRGRGRGRGGHAARGRQ